MTIAIATRKQERLIGDIKQYMENVDKLVAELIALEKELKEVHPEVLALYPYASNGRVLLKTDAFTDLVAAAGDIKTEKDKEGYTHCSTKIQGIPICTVILPVRSYEKAV